MHRCFDGKYPIELPGETALGKNVIEHMLATAPAPVFRCSPTTTTCLRFAGPKPTAAQSDLNRSRWRFRR